MFDSSDYSDQDTDDSDDPHSSSFHPASVVSARSPSLSPSFDTSSFIPACQGDDFFPDSPFGSFSHLRSFACEKHSKWKKKCPANCPQRKEHTRVPLTRRKLWTKEENRQLLQRVDPGLVAREDGDAIWGEIAKELHRSVNSTKKKYMRYD